MAELADALDSGSSEDFFMQVQVLFPAPKRNPCNTYIAGVFLYDLLESYTIFYTVEGVFILFQPAMT
jgi:hypothetical protein